ncbi:MAG: phage tail protein, partial [Thermoanaerobaculia bacterium]
MSRTLAAVCFVSLVLVPATLLAEKKDSVFALKVPGVGDATGTAFFKSVEGLKSETEVIEIREGGDNGAVHKAPGRTTYSNIKLARAVSSDTSVATWRKQVEDGQIEPARRSGAIVLLDKSNREVARWNIVNAWPSAIEIVT